MTQIHRCRAFWGTLGMKGLRNVFKKVMTDSQIEEILEHLRHEWVRNISKEMCMMRDVQTNYTLGYYRHEWV